MNSSALKSSSLSLFILLACLTKVWSSLDRVWYFVIQPSFSWPLTSQDSACHILWREVWPSLIPQESSCRVQARLLRKGCQWDRVGSAIAGETENWIHLLLWKGTLSLRVKMCCCLGDLSKLMQRGILEEAYREHMEIACFLFLCVWLPSLPLSF